MFPKFYAISAQNYASIKEKTRILNDYPGFFYCSEYLCKTLKNDILIRSKITKKQALALETTEKHNVKTDYISQTRSSFTGSALSGKD